MTWTMCNTGADYFEMYVYSVDTLDWLALGFDVSRSIRLFAMNRLNVFTEVVGHGASLIRRIGRQTVFGSKVLCGCLPLNRGMRCIST